jgi:LacI family transcriptional regulator/LacI family repressor for deo operon, udp, cdd, tsx, nupC, and nupG
VLEIIEELDYAPSPLARKFSLGKTLTIAAVIPFFTRPSAVERLRGIASTLADTEYDLIVIDLEEPERYEAYFSKLARGVQVDGVLLISIAPRQETLERIIQSGTPLVLIDVNDPTLEGHSRVIVDDVEGGRLATQHLLDLGHTRVGYIGDRFVASDYFTSSKHRFEGYQSAMQEAGIPVLERYFRHGLHGRYEARLLAAEMLQLQDPPSAIFAASDTQAVGVLEAARDAGFRVPQDLSVMGYDDIEIAEHLNLTTIRQLLFESGVHGVKLLFEKIQSPERESTTIVLPTELMVRETTAPPVRS